MVEISFVMPKFIRKQSGLLNTILRLEEEGENLHQIFAIRACHIDVGPMQHMAPPVIFLAYIQYTIDF